MKNLKNFIPLIIDVIVTGIVLIVYGVTEKNQEILTYVQILVAPVLLSIATILIHLKIVHIPLIALYLMMVHLILALDLGGAFNFYDWIPSWDMILHGYFGFFFSVIVAFVLLNFGGEHLNKAVFLILIFFITMGAAGLWEIYEFTLDSLFGTDSQRVEESIALGLSPLHDTMMDIIIAIAGIVAFYIGIGIDKLFGFRYSKKLFLEIKNHQE
jgi:hypothetical protein